MSRLPNSERAVLDVRKLEEYCLSPEHPRGRHKARVFRDALGIRQAEADWLRSAILAGLGTDAAESGADAFGVRW